MSDPSSSSERSVVSSGISKMTPEEILDRARSRANDLNLMCAGAVFPEEAWALVQADAAVIVDVRTQEEHEFVGYVPGSILIPWMYGNSMSRNPGFIAETARQLGKDVIILMLCRSAKRSARAAEALTFSGFTNVFNILEGFEGDLDENMQRNHINGWRFKKLPWLQE